jgi:hypothetical protein
MKTRTCFVSNSSSSSFIIVGAKVAEDTIEGLDTLWTDDNGTIIAGKILSDDECIDDGEMSFEQLTATFDLVSSKLGVDKSQVKLYYGTRPS